MARTSYIFVRWW